MLTAYDSDVVMFVTFVFSRRSHPAAISNQCLLAVGAMLFTRTYIWSLTNYLLEFVYCWTLDGSVSFHCCDYLLRDYRLQELVGWISVGSCD